ncbi:conserved hypothetical protein [Thiomonas sp. X19]|uniref:hypothetical protein n=1 Tax=Thiomonas sp. X19 TaxID=1050370 RepID=UPI000B6ABDEE|nr:hypothetical protein [Thiomonas sp. X19]SCC92942.1 conserved hypothetical protein [Thiomonas sp. X19]
MMAGSWFATLGALVGGFIGFLMRPSVPLIGQLPFRDVISRGADLQGLDAVLLRNVAQQSFNYVLAGAIVGAVGGYVLYLISKKN